jgi:Ser/Thr protein kinase RdoA (MazF antagonist)
MERARFVAAISKHNKDYLLRLAPGVSPDKISVVHCGIELEKYGTRGDRASDRSNPAGGQITGICVASLQPYKGIRHLICASAQVLRREPGFRCLIVGEGVDRPKLEALIDELGLQHTVRLLGGKPQHEVAKLLADADLFVLPSVVAPSGQMDGIPVALMEAMASGLPVVSTRLSGIPELVEDGVNGLLVEAGNETALADAITTLAGKPEMRRRMGERGREKVAAEFELQGCVASLRGLIEETMSAAGTRPFAGSGDDGANSVGREVAAWVGEELSRADGKAVDVTFSRLGGGADSDVFQVNHTGGKAPAGNLILKLHRPNGPRAAGTLERARAEAENDFIALSFLWSVFLPHSTRLAVPRPLALNNDQAAVLMEKCQGERLDHAMRWARFRGSARNSLRDWFTSCGEWLAIFHQASESREDPAPIFAGLESGFHENLRLCRERGLDEDLVSMAVETFEARKGEAFDPGMGLVGRHCDFAPYNVLVAGDRVSVIDFEGLQLGVPYDDLCYFVRMLGVTPPYHLSRSMIGELRDAFLKGYERHRSLDRGTLEFFMLLATVKVMARTPVLRPPTTWLDAAKRWQRLRFYRSWFRETLHSTATESSR